LLLAIFLVGCSTDTEKRIADLERRVAYLEKGSPTSTSLQNSGSTPVVTASNPQDEIKPEGPLPEFAFAETTFDFGDITEGDVVNHVFGFENKGDIPLVIESAKASCGCTVPRYSNEPIPVGGTGEIEVSFNSKGKPGVQNKTVTITANTFPKITKLFIKSVVKKTGDETASADGSK